MDRDALITADAYGTESEPSQMHAHRQRKQHARQDFVWQSGAEAAETKDVPTSTPASTPTPSPAPTPTPTPARASTPAPARARVQVGVAAAVILAGGTVWALETTSSGTATTVRSVAQLVPATEVPTQGLAPSAASSSSALEAVSPSAVASTRGAASVASSSAASADTTMGRDPAGAPSSTPSSTPFKAASSTSPIQALTSAATSAAPQPATTPTTASTTSAPSGCSTQWATSTAYVRGDEVSYNGQLWSANQWNYNEVPGGAAGAWNSIGTC